MHYSALKKIQILPAAKPLDILLVEDDDSDSALTHISLDANYTDYTMHRLTSGEEVLPYLRRQGRYRHEAMPDVLLLDLSLPKKDGFEVLADLSTHAERFGQLPIVILTGDTHSAFLIRSYDLNIAAYITKPCSPQKIRAALARGT